MSIKVRYEPRKEVIIHEYSKYDSSEEFINNSVMGAPPGAVVTALKWVDGVLISFSALPINEVTSKEIIEGRLHWDHVSFAPMPEYKEQVVTPNGITVIIRDVSNNPVFKRIAEFIKENF
jgi:hypothetical protein